MANEYRIGDKVRRIEAPNAVVMTPIGSIGEVVSRDDDGFFVQWPGAKLFYGWGTRCVELVSPAVEPAVDMRGQLGQHPQHWTQTLEPAAAVKVCSSECEDAKEAVEALVARNTTVGDLLGERDHLRSRVAELEAALGFAERELCRMKRGRR